MSDTKIQAFETRPNAVEAVLWDGSKKHAKAIVKWLTKHKKGATWSEYIGQTPEGALSNDIGFNFNADPIGREPGKTFLLPGEWVVYYPHSDTLRLFTADEFADRFRVRAVS